MLGLQLEFAAAVYRQARDQPFQRRRSRSSPVTPYADSPSGCALGFLRDASESKLFSYSVASLTGAANRDDSAIALSLALSPSRALATHSKTYLQADWLKVT